MSIFLGIFVESELRGSEVCVAGGGLACDDALVVCVAAWPVFCLCRFAV